MTDRIAIAIFNLGGPDGPAAVAPFLYNLFSDPEILAVAAPFRQIGAWLISRLRAKTSQGYYDEIGGRSILLEQTLDQGRALEGAVAVGETVKVFTFMRYWHPFAAEAVAAIKAFAPTRVVVLPMYPQFSRTTTGTSVDAFRREAARQNLVVPVSVVCCYPAAEGWMAAMEDNISPVIAEAGKHGRPHVLFSAHGLPQKIIDRGDPYQEQVIQSARAMAARLKLNSDAWSICYQSRVGPVKWTEPSVDAEIRRIANLKVPIVLVPIAFVSEHTETLVELDKIMRVLALAHGAPFYGRVRTVGTHPRFIGALADLVKDALAGGSAYPGDIHPSGGRRHCGPASIRCPLFNR